MLNQNSTSNSSTIKKRPSWLHLTNLPKLNPGTILEAKIIKKTPKALYLDLNQYGAGLIWGAEFIKSADIIKDLKEGDIIRVRVVNPENEFGMVEVVLHDIAPHEQYQQLKELVAKDEVLTGKVLGANRGGLLIKVGDIQGFLPTSQMSEDNFPKVEGGNKEKILEALEQLVGKEIKVKILNFTPSDGKIIFSEKKIEEDKIKNLISKYKVGDIVEGSVYKITSGGAIISLKEHPLIKAFLPIDEASWSPVDKLDTILQPNTFYQFKITSINKNGEIILSLKALEQDPIIEKLKNYQPQQIIKGRVYKFLPFGALIQIDADIFGFIHSSEFGGIEKMKEQLELNKEEEFVISNINLNEKRINLQLKKD
ncbi:MAG: S1 RNA-binding domain-containing protein [Minisyncoccia bacterium]